MQLAVTHRWGDTILAETHALLLYHLPMLLLYNAPEGASARSPLQPASGSGSASSPPTSYKAIHGVRARIVLAETQQWMQLVQDLAQAQQSQRDKLLANGGNHPALRPETTATRKFELACDKIRGDCLRSASQILLGAGVPAPGPDTTAATKLRFKCGLSTQLLRLSLPL